MAIISGNASVNQAAGTPKGQAPKRVAEESGLPVDGFVAGRVDAPIEPTASGTLEAGGSTPPVNNQVEADRPAIPPEKVPTVLCTVGDNQLEFFAAGLGLGAGKASDRPEPQGIFLDQLPTSLETRELGLREVNNLRPAQYASAARSALLSYLPKEDVDSAKALKGYLKDPTYQHSLWKGDDNKFHYTSGFAHDLGGQGRAIQLDFHSLLEGEPPNIEGGKLIFERFLEKAGAKIGGADYLFVEVTPEMQARYQQIDPRFVEFAPPGKNSAGDDYTLLALPTSPGAANRLQEQSTEVFRAYVESWCTKNLGDDWKATQPEALAAYHEMMTADRPVWSQPPLPT